MGSSSVQRALPTKNPSPPKYHLVREGAMGAFLDAVVPPETPNPAEFAFVAARSYTSQLPHPDPAKRRDPSHPTGDYIEGYWSSQMGTNRISDFMFTVSNISGLRTLYFTGGAAACGNMSELTSNLKCFKHPIHVVLKDNSIDTFALHTLGVELAFLAAGSIVDVDEPGLATPAPFNNAPFFHSLPDGQPRVLGQYRIYNQRMRETCNGVPVYRDYACEWHAKEGRGFRYLTRTTEVPSDV